MKRICEFCKKKYDWVEGQPNWTKDGVGNGKNTIRSDKFCCYRCGINDKNQKRKNTAIKKIGFEYYLQSAEFKEKVKQTKIQRYGCSNAWQFGSPEHKKAIREKYGVDNVAQNEEIKEKIKKTNQKRYGGNCSMCSKNVREKSKQTKKERYGDENFNNMGKCKKTKQEKYGDENYNNPKKCGQTKEERYGNKNYNNTEKAKKTNQKRYGGNCSMCSKEVREKSKQTMMKKYGVDNPIQSPEIRQKVYNTKKKNHTFNASKPEKEIEKLLLEKFPDTKNQYKSELYPFVCDFYIPSLDLYIEFQGFWVHGKEPYNENKEEHIVLLEEWENRAKSSPQYKKAIDTWTTKDPLKRKTAKDNNLNWIEFFSLEDFLEWYEKQ